MNRLLCILETLWRSLRSFAIVSGCEYHEVECRDARIDLLQCHRCGRFDASWRYERPAGWRTV